MKPQVYKKEPIPYAKWKLIVNRGLLSSCLLGIVLLSQSTFLDSFSSEQQLTLGLLVFAIYLWTLGPLPSGAVSMLVLSSMLILGLTDTVEEAVAGFLSPALYFIFVLSLISQALTRVGIDKVIARMIMKMSKGGAHIIIIGLPLFMLVLPIVLPSAVARFKILFPLVERLNEYYGYSEKSLFKKYCAYILGIFNQTATMIIFTGGGLAVLAWQLIRDYHIAEISWIEWLLKMAPPIWIGLIILMVLAWQFFKKTTPVVDQKKTATQKKESQSIQSESIPAKLWVVIGTFICMIFVWIFTNPQHVPLVLPPMLLVVIYSLPSFGLIDNQLIRNYDWENFLLLGSSFSLALLIDNNGTAEVLAGQLIMFIPTEAGEAIKVVIIALLVYIIRFLFTVPSSALVVIFPIIISYAELIGVQSIALALLVLLIIGGMTVIPIHSPTTFYAFETGVLSKKEQYVMGTFSSFLMMIVAVIAALYYW
ncbi:SLC13 family permease [Salinibacillus kushneri]|nr:SLC13 family permease [Salinibacillus kushneri]